MAAPAALRAHLKTLIVNACGLTHVTPEELTDDEILFGPTTRVGLNSLDAVEIALNIGDAYGVQLKNSSSAREYFQSIATLSDHVASQMAPERLSQFE